MAEVQEKQMSDFLIVIHNLQSSPAMSICQTSNEPKQKEEDAVDG